MSLSALILSMSVAMRLLLLVAALAMLLSAIVMVAVSCQVWKSLTHVEFFIRVPLPSTLGGAKAFLAY